MEETIPGEGDEGGRKRTQCMKNWKRSLWEVCAWTIPRGEGAQTWKCQGEAMKGLHSKKLGPVRFQKFLVR